MDFDFLINKLIKDTKNKDTKKNILIRCLSSTGYIKDPVQENEEEYTYPEPQFIINTDKTDSVELKKGFNENLSFDRFNRTYITQDEEGPKRLHKVQNYIISNEETEFKKVNEIVENILNKLKLESYILKNNIMEFYLKYSKNIKGQTKEGLIILSIYYNVVNVKLEHIIYYSGFKSPNIKEADKIINFKMEYSLFGMETFLIKQFDKSVLKDIYDTLDSLKGVIFDIPPTKIQTAATIYYIINKKNGKIKMKDNNLFTYNILKKYCNVSDDTVKKTVDLIISYQQQGR